MQKQEDLRSQDKILERSKELILREIELCKTLRAMISRELEAIVLNSDLDELFRVLDQKDKIISQLQLLADGWKDVLHENTRTSLINLYPNDHELSELIIESREIADSIMKAEDQAISELEKYQTDLRSQMVRRVKNKNAAASYARMGGSII